MILKLNTLTEAQVRALHAFIEKENRTAVADWRPNFSSGDHKVTDYTFLEAPGETPLVKVLDPGVDFDQETGFFKVTLEVHETSKPAGRLEGCDARNNMRMLTLRPCIDRLFDVLSIFPRSSTERKVDVSRSVSYDGYALPAPVPLLSKPKEDKPAAPAQS